MAGEILAQLPEDLRANAAFTGMNSAADMAKALLETKGKVTEFEGKVKDYEGKHADLNKRLENSIPRLQENATPEQKAAYLKAMGVPEKPEGYEFKDETGKNIDTKISQWARNTFHKNGVPANVAQSLNTEFNAFMKGVIAEEAQAREKEATEAAVKLKTKLGDKYDGTVEGVKRFWKKVTTTEYDAFVNETKIGNDARFIDLLVYLAEKTGEDFSPASGPQRGFKKGEGIVYDKSPKPPAKT
jgi:hypothetical protein